MLSWWRKLRRWKEQKRRREKSEKFEKRNRGCGTPPALDLHARSEPLKFSVAAERGRVSCSFFFRETKCLLKKVCPFPFGLIFAHAGLMHRKPNPLVMENTSSVEHPHSVAAFRCFHHGCMSRKQSPCRGGTLHLLSQQGSQIEGVCARRRRATLPVTKGHVTNVTSHEHVFTQW